MVDLSNLQVNAAEFIPGRLYFVMLNTDISPKSIAHAHYFSIDTEQYYYGFYDDFGPLNISILYHYCAKLDRKLSNVALKNKKIVHYVGLDERCRVNSAFLIGAYAIIKLGFSPVQTYALLTDGCQINFWSFRDASIGEPYTLHLLDCLKAIKLAQDYGFFNFDNFDFFEYEHYESVENGDLNWIVPNKFLAFCGPQQKSAVKREHPIHSPETYFSYFRRHHVSTIIRLNSKTYDAELFTNAGFQHEHLFFIDGGVPNDRITNRFLQICENAKGAIAVHCKAGLGRTGTLIACYIMKHYRFTAEEAIAWLRICRPGSIIAHQQTWLKEHQDKLWEAGKVFRTLTKTNVPTKHKFGIYSVSNMNFDGEPNKNENNNDVDVDDDDEDDDDDDEDDDDGHAVGGEKNTKNETTRNSRNNSSNNLIGIVKKVDLMEISESGIGFDLDPACFTQGDRLNQIKAQRINKPSTKLRKGYGLKVGRDKVGLPRPISKGLTSRNSRGLAMKKCDVLLKPGMATTSKMSTSKDIKTHINTVKKQKKKENVRWTIGKKASISVTVTDEGHSSGTSNVKVKTKNTTK